MRLCYQRLWAYIAGVWTQPYRDLDPWEWLHGNVIDGAAGSFTEQTGSAGCQPIPAATRQSLGTSQRGFFIHLPPNSLDYRDRYGLQQVRYVKAIVPIGLGKQSGILCVVQLLEQRIVALTVTRTHACFENRLRVFNAPTEPRRLAWNFKPNLSSLFSDSSKKTIELNKKVYSLLE